MSDLESMNICWICSFDVMTESVIVQVNIVLRRKPSFREYEQRQIEQ